MSSLWDNPAIIDRLRELVPHSDYSFTQIASALSREFALDISRNATIGKAGRLRLRRPKIDKPPIEARAAKRRRRRLTPPLLGLKTELVALPNIDDQKIPVTQRRSLMELTGDTCRWPVGEPTNPDFFFCGAGVLSKLPYCAGHYRRACP